VAGVTDVLRLFFAVMVVLSAIYLSILNGGRQGQWSSGIDYACLSTNNTTRASALELVVWRSLLLLRLICRQQGLLHFKLIDSALQQVKPRRLKLGLSILFVWHQAHLKEAMSVKWWIKKFPQPSHRGVKIAMQANKSLLLGSIASSPKIKLFWFFMIERKATQAAKHSLHQIRKRRHIGPKCRESTTPKERRKLVGIWRVAGSPLLQTETLRVCAHNAQSSMQFKGSLVGPLWIEAELF